MAAAELLDYNQIQEQSPATGETLPSSGGPIIWQFRADPNLAWDPSQSFFAMDVTLNSVGDKISAAGVNGSVTKDVGGVTVANTLGSASAPKYIPGGADLRPFFPLRCFSQASHVIDGVTVANSTHPYLDKIIQEKFLHETTQSNYSNYESLQLARAIDDGIKDHNIFRACGAGNFTDLYEQGWTIRAIEQYDPSARLGEMREHIINLGMHAENLANAQGTKAAVGAAADADNKALDIEASGKTYTELFFPIQGAKPTHTILFQPPFDFWTKHQRVSGGNHQITLNLRPEDPLYGHGVVASTPCVGINFQAAAAACSPGAYLFGAATASQAVSGLNDELDVGASSKKGITDTGLVPAALHQQMGIRSNGLVVTGVAIQGTGVDLQSDAFAAATPSLEYSNISGPEAMVYRNLASYTQKLHMKIDRIRLLRRVVRFTIERPIATQEYNLTEMQLYVGQPAGRGVQYDAATVGALAKEGISGAQVTQNFLLPSSTFGLIFFWRDAQSDQFDVIGDYPTVELGAVQGDANKGNKHIQGPKSKGIQERLKKFALDEFFFTYGGETYPSQRINDITSEKGGAPFGYEKLQTISQQLMGSYNMPMEYINQSFAGKGLMERLDGHMFFFPVAKHSNSDNSDLQVTWKGSVGHNFPSGVTLCVVALYDARIELSYNSANQLEKVTKTEWK